MTDREWREKWLRIARRCYKKSDDLILLCCEEHDTFGGDFRDGYIQRMMVADNMIRCEAVWPEGDNDSRGLFACLMAAMGQREARKLVEVSK